MTEFFDFWVKQWDSWPVQLVVWGAILALMVVSAVFLVRRLRDSTASAEEDTAHLLTNFREMKVQGDISDAEFRTINSLLNVKQPAKVKHAQDNT